MQDKQENCQIILIRGSDSRPIVSLPQLQKKFQTVGMVNDDIKLQLKEFSFHTEFPTIYQGDYLNFWASVKILYNDPNYPVYQYKTTDIPFRFNIDIPDNVPNLTTTSQEFVDVLEHNRLRNVEIYMIDEDPADTSDPGTYSPEKTNRRICAGLLLNSYFGFDASTGKITWTFKARTRWNIWYTEISPGVVVPPDADDEASYLQHRFLDVSLLMQTGDRLQPLDQYRLSNICGMNAINSQLNQLQGLYGHEFYSDASEYYLNRVLYTDPVRFFMYKGIQKDEFTFHSPHMSDSVPVKFIVIKSSCRSNYVFSQAKREPILQSIPVQSQSTSLYQSFYNDTDLYTVSDTIQGVKNMQLEITDENGQELVFRVPYELKIAVFF